MKFNRKSIQNLIGITHQIKREKTTNTLFKRENAFKGIYALCLKSFKNRWFGILHKNWESSQHIIWSEWLKMGECLQTELFSNLDLWNKIHKSVVVAMSNLLGISRQKAHLRKAILLWIGKTTATCNKQIRQSHSFWAKFCLYKSE